MSHIMGYYTYNNVTKFYNGYAKVQINNHKEWLFIDTNGNIIYGNC